MIRCFEDDDIIHVDGHIDPVRDIETIDLELLLKDVETMTAKRDRCRKRRSDKESQAAADVLDKALALADAGKPVRAMGLSDDEMEHLKECQLITAKPMLFVCNVADDELPDGNEFSAKVQAHAEAAGAAAIIISGKIEEELSALDEDERQMFMDDLGIQEPGLHSLVKAGYALLNLQTYFTAGEKEVRAWQISQGWLRRRPRALFIPISRLVLSALKLPLMMIMSAYMVKKAAARPVNCGPKAKTTLFKTATSCIFSLINRAFSCLVIFSEKWAAMIWHRSPRRFSNKLTRVALTPCRC